MKLLNEKAHAEKGASGASRWLACPGSVALEKFFHEQSSVFADEGTLAHSLGERCLDTGEDPINYLFKTQSDFDILADSQPPKEEIKNG